MRQLTAPAYSNLLDRHFGAGFLELLLGSFGVSFVGTFEHGLRSALDQSLGFRQTQAGFHFTNGFDHGDLLVGGSGFEDHVESVLGFGSRSATSGSATSGG